MLLQEVMRARHLRLSAKLAYVTLTHDKDPAKGAKLTFLWGMEEIHSEYFPVAEVVGQLGSKVDPRLRAMGYTPQGNERLDIPNEWFGWSGGFARYLGAVPATGT